MSRSRVILVATAAVLVLAGCGDNTKSDAPKAAPAPTPARTTPALLTTPPETPPVIEPAWWHLTVKILEKKCFGSAGCNVTYRIDPKYDGELDPSRTYRMTYEVSGVEDGPQINNFTVTGTEASIPSEESAQTKTTKVKLTAKVTDMVEE